MHSKALFTEEAEDKEKQKEKMMEAISDFSEIAVNVLFFLEVSWHSR